tara:strand:+ start:2194 stop:2646 length:453 start_codon:yes stop_codon:yes gene_type:complete
VSERLFTTRRAQIVTALVTKLKGINGLGSFLSNVNDNVVGRLLFWDEVNQFPAIHLNAGSETREYLGGGQKVRFLSVTVRCYVKAEDAVLSLDQLLEDIETVLETNSRLAYLDSQSQTQFTQQITVLSIDTDEGVLEPLAVGEMLLEVRY